MLPADYGLFVEEFKNHPTGTIWIMKPTGSAQGKGIFLFTKLSAINEWKKDHTWKNAEEAKAAAAYVVQRYIENPQLIGGKKFDLRLYVLVTSYRPLKAYIHRNGALTTRLARCFVKLAPDLRDIWTDNPPTFLRK